MPFNGPIGGDYSVCDPNKAPWTQEIATLTHAECAQVKEGIQNVIDNYDPADNSGQEISETYIHSKYNNSDWQYAVNWNTYLTLKNYDPEVHKDGITEQGIVGTYEQPTESPAE